MPDQVSSSARASRSSNGRAVASSPSPSTPTATGGVPPFAAGSLLSMIVQFIHWQYGGDNATGELKEMGVQTEDERKDPHVRSSFLIHSFLHRGVVVCMIP